MEKKLEWNLDLMPQNLVNSMAEKLVEKAVHLSEEDFALELADTPDDVLHCVPILNDISHWPKSHRILFINEVRSRPNEYGL